MEHIQSTENHQIIELIQSPLLGSAGLIPPLQSKRTKADIAQQIQPYTSKYICWDRDWIAIFAYPDTLARIDGETFPDDIQVFVF